MQASLLVNLAGKKGMNETEFKAKNHVGVACRTRADIKSPIDFYP